MVRIHERTVAVETREAFIEFFAILSRALQNQDYVEIAMNGNRQGGKSPAALSMWLGSAPDKDTSYLSTEEGRSHSLPEAKENKTATAEITMKGQSATWAFQNGGVTFLDKKRRYLVHQARAQINQEIKKTSGRGIAIIANTGSVPRELFGLDIEIHSSRSRDKNFGALEVVGAVSSYPTRMAIDAKRRPERRLTGLWNEVDKQETGTPFFRGITLRIREGSPGAKLLNDPHFLAFWNNTLGIRSTIGHYDPRRCWARSFA